MDEDPSSSLADHVYPYDERFDSDLAESAKQSNNDETDAAFMRPFLPHLDPDTDDPFDPLKFDKKKMKYVKPQQMVSGVLPVNLLAQIDLFHILLRDEYSLSMMNKIMGCVVHYSSKEPKDNIWPKYCMESRKSFIQKI